MFDRLHAEVPIAPEKRPKSPPYSYALIAFASMTFYASSSSWAVEAEARQVHEIPAKNCILVGRVHIQTFDFVTMSTVLSPPLFDDATVQVVVQLIILSPVLLLLLKTGPLILKHCEQSSVHPNRDSKARTQVHDSNQRAVHASSLLSVGLQLRRGKLVDRVKDRQSNNASVNPRDAEATSTMTS
jgi:hypothetical protein